MRDETTLICDMKDSKILELWIACIIAHPELDDWEQLCKEEEAFLMPWNFYNMGEMNQHTERELNYLLGVRLLDSDKKPLLLNWKDNKGDIEDLDIRYIEFAPDRLDLYTSLMRANMHLYDNDDGDYQSGYLEPLLYFITQFSHFYYFPNVYQALPHEFGVYNTNKWLKDSGRFREGFKEVGDIGFFE
tara:strand:- start:94 stop:657 length:564 start_codon:yes stop_codon:yes gene_type:complete